LIAGEEAVMWQRKNDLSFMALHGGAVMLEHYLTVVQLKKLYSTDYPPGLVYIHEGLHPEDARKFGLSPVISFMITVAGHKIYHQHLLEDRQIISIVNFLLHSWKSIPKLGGVPDKLTISPDLEKAYPLKKLIEEIDPLGTIQVSISKNQSISASLRYAQNNVSCIVNMDKPESEITSLPDLLMIVNSELKPDESFYFYSEVPTDPPKPNIFERIHHSHPGHNHIFQPDATDIWLAKPALAVPRLADGMSLYYLSENEPNWINELVINKQAEETPIYGVDEAFKYKNDPHNDYFFKDMRMPGFVWIDEEYGFKETIGLLTYDTNAYLSVIVDPVDLKDFLSGSRPMIWALYEQLRDRITSTPAILLANKSKQVDDVTGYMNISHAFELTGSNSDDISYRLFSMIADYDTKFLLAIKKHSTADNKTIRQKFLNYNGELDIGTAGLAALEFFVKMINLNSKHGFGEFAIDMMDQMLTHDPEWANYDQ
jgi:hypothetical protein